MTDAIAIARHDLLTAGQLDDNALDVKNLDV